MKILFLPKYPRLGASSRLRTYQYLPLWEAAGHQVEVAPFFDEAYLRGRYVSGKAPKRGLVGRFLRRAWWALKASQYDLVVLEKEVFPYFPAWMEGYWQFRGIRYVVDYDDAVFHNYDLNPKFLVRFLLGRKIDRVMARSGMVWAGNVYLAQRALEAGAQQVKILPTVVDDKHYHPKKGGNDTGLRIGWIGSPTTLRYLKELLPVLERLKCHYDFTMVIIANGEGIGFSGEEELFQWHEEDEVRQLGTLDIGIMPLSNSPWEKGKCAYKLIQYMACGLPVVATPVGMNREVVQNGVNGYWASTKEEWVSALASLLSDAELRRKMGHMGRKMVKKKYTLDKNWSKVREWTGA